jgi:arginine exporter protein ArgO
MAVAVVSYDVMVVDTVVVCDTVVVVGGVVAVVSDAASLWYRLSTMLCCSVCFRPLDGICVSKGTHRGPLSQVTHLLTLIISRQVN